MSKAFKVSLNNQTIHTYSEPRIPGRLMRYIDEMNSDMDKGIQLGEQWVTTPSSLQKIQYVSMILLDSLQNNDVNLINVTSAFLANQFDSETEIQFTQQDDLFNLKITSK